MNYTGVGRSNYVNFTEPDTVRMIVGWYAMDLQHNDRGYAIMAERYSETGDLNYYIPEDELPDRKDEWLELGMIDPFKPGEEPGEFKHLGKVLAKYIPEGEVLIWQHVGFEGLRYLSGYAWAVNHFGKIRSINLDFIENLAKGMGDPDKITSVAY